MNQTSYQIELLKLPDGTRMIRANDPVTRTALERRLDPDKPVVAQKDAVLRALTGVLAREFKETAALS